jgi:hypothetical protein
MKAIAKKLHAAKLEIGKVSKNATNPHFKSRYTDINALLEAVEPILLKYDLVLLQPISDGYVSTIIVDVETGEQATSSIVLPTQLDPQKLGSAITYFRRYTLQSLLALQAEDDDANTATAAHKPTQPTKPQLTAPIATAEAAKGTTVEQLKAKYTVTSEQELKYKQLLNK